MAARNDGRDRPTLDRTNDNCVEQISALGHHCGLEGPQLGYEIGLSIGQSTVRTTTHDVGQDQSNHGIAAESSDDPDLGETLMNGTPST